MGDVDTEQADKLRPAAGYTAPAGAAYAYVGDRLRELRKQSGLTQVEVARIISVSPQQYQKYEDAQSKCSLTTLIALSEHYDVALASLLPPTTLVAETPPAEPPRKLPDIPTEADLLARLVGAFVKLRDTEQKTRFVQLVEAIQNSHDRTS
ncbi:helix-turn-helix domain-containing protein [Tabrizicola sp.]|uniref:helix-turn-helix domain-containing protein n=1 Tax=Tabrizicola sp. TaxID=2005166 RepID=UPI003F2CE0E1